MSDDKRAQTIQGLRELADFLEAHPTVPLPADLWGLTAFPKDRDELAAIARAATWQKKYLDTWFMLTRAFSGGVELQVTIERETVCRKVVTGTRIVPAQPEREVDTYEWVCEDAALLAEPAVQS